MELASTVILDILQEMQVQASEQPIQAADSTTVIRYMNRFMASLAVRGVSIGYTKIVNPSDLVTIPDGALDGLIFSVAKRLLNQYDIPLTAELQLSCKEGMDAMWKLGVTSAPTSHPSTMPIGSGNEGYGNGNGNGGITHFYPGSDEEIVGTEDNKNIGLESNT
jgi:hypothetical protein